MAKSNKKIRTGTQKAAQATRSERNKANRLARNRKIREVSAANKQSNGHLSPFKAAKLNNRLRRLNRKLNNRNASLGTDERGRYQNRVEEINKLLTP